MHVKQSGAWASIPTKLSITRLSEDGFRRCQCPVECGGKSAGEALVTDLDIVRRQFPRATEERRGLTHTAGVMVNEGQLRNGMRMIAVDPERVQILDPRGIIIAGRKGLVGPRQMPVQSRLFAATSGDEQREAQGEREEEQVGFHIEDEDEGQSAEVSRQSSLISAKSESRRATQSHDAAQSSLAPCLLKLTHTPHGERAGVSGRAAGAAR
jgi:hypothetical protein